MIQAGHCSMRVLIATDAWSPQINGVVKTLEATIAELRRRGAGVEVIHPGLFRSIPLPGYPQIPIALPRRKSIAALLDAFAPTHLHIATEGPIGWVTRSLCIKRGLAFTTSYHTCFPEYLRERAPVPLWLTYSAMRRFHAPSYAVMVATASIEARLIARRFGKLVRWSRGVDLSRFHPDVAMPDDMARLPRPIFLSVGRLAAEKNLDAFLSLDLPGSKLVIGDGPELDRLARTYPSAVFLGAKPHHALPGYFAHSDVFVFPSLTDTFGLVQIEAMACGAPVAAFLVAGPLDVITQPGVGVMSDDLQTACLLALGLDRAACVAHAQGFSWRTATDQFAKELVSAPLVAQTEHPSERAIPAAASNA
jgi:glycosyltransferase involved in cell wall biosynthesis